MRSALIIIFTAYPASNRTFSSPLESPVNVLIPLILEHVAIVMMLLIEVRVVVGDGLQMDQAAGRVLRIHNVLIVALGVQGSQAETRVLRREATTTTVLLLKELLEALHSGLPLKGVHGLTGRLNLMRM